MKKSIEGNLSIGISKMFSGFNMNALKFLLPVWIAPITGVTFRLVFGAIAFWIIGIFCKPENATLKQKLYLLLLGGLGMYGFMAFYLAGLSYTTPVSSSIFLSLEPIWVFVITVIFFGERITSLKIFGILLGLSGALLCIIFQPTNDLASNAFLGNMFSLISSVIYAIFLIFSKRLLIGIGNMTMLKFTFLGAAIVSVVVNYFYGFDAPILSQPFFSLPVLALLFVLLFPTTLSYLLLPIGLKYLSATLVAIYGYLILVVATITSFILGQDRFSWIQCAAIILICISVYLVEIAEKKSSSSEPKLN